MKLIDAIHAVLEQAKGPLHYKEITQRILDQGLWSTQGQTPWDTVNARIAVDLKRYKECSHYQRHEQGTFALNPGFDQEARDRRHRALTGRHDSAQGDTNILASSLEILRQAGQPLHYKEIARRMVDQGLWSGGLSLPQDAVLSRLAHEARKGQDAQIQRVHRGTYALAHTAPEDEGLHALIEQHNQKIQRQLHQRLSQMEPTTFEELIGELLGAMGFDEVEVTRASNDGGIDVRGTLVVAEVIRTRMAVQVKRWKKNLHAPTVQQVRGSLGAHEQGLIITTSDFSQGARKEAARADATPVALMNGAQLVRLLMRYEMGVQRSTHHLFALEPHT